MKHTKIFLSLVVFAFLATPNVRAYEDDNDLVGYDSLVKELSSSRYQTHSGDYSDPLNEVKFHAGLGYATSFISIDPEGTGRLNGLMRGVEFSFGIDLLSKDWVAEGTVRSFQQKELNPETQISLREFDLKVLYNNQLSRGANYKIGGGLASRYLTFKSRNTEQVAKDRYSTPASVLTTGVELLITPKIGLSGDVAYRWSLIDETVDESAFDANLRLNAHF